MRGKVGLGWVRIAGIPPVVSAALGVLPLLGSQSGIISTIAGTGTAGYCGDGGPATATCLSSPIGVAVKGNNNIFIADTFNSRIRQFRVGGAMSTVAGNGTAGFCGDWGPATNACLNFPEAVATDSYGNLFIADTFNNRIRLVTANGIIITIAGDGTADFCGDGTVATRACLNGPRSIAVDGGGNIFIADTFNNRIRQISRGIITTVAGTGTPGFCGDGGPASSACLQFPIAVAVDPDGNLLITDLGNERIRKVNHGIITTVAGNGVLGFCGDGGPAISACLSGPVGIAVESSGNLFIADTGNQRVREVSSQGIINSVAGNGSSGFCGDGGLAVDACLNGPTSVGFDRNDLFIVDQQNNRIRRVRS